MMPPQPLLKVPETSEIELLMKKIISEYDKTIDNITHTITEEDATFGTVVQAWANTDNVMQGPLGMIFNLQYCSPSLETQDAVQDAIKLWQEAEAKWARRDDFFKLLQSVLQKEQINPGLDQESQFLLEERVRVYVKCGYGRLSEEKIAAYLQDLLEIGKLCSEYRRNIAQESGGVWFTEQELEGVPADELAKWKSDKTSSGQTKKFVPFANGGTLAVLKYAHSPETRRCIYVNNDQKLAINVPLFEEVIKLRFGEAQMLGFSSHAAVRAKDRAVRSSEWIEDFLEKIKNRLVALAQKEVTALQTLRIEDQNAREIFKECQGEGFPAWDKPYYHNLMQKAANVDEEKISEYFPLEYVTGAMLNLFTSFLGIRFDRIPDDELDKGVKWHDSVEIFAVWDGPADEAKFIGHLYLDLVWREHKYRGNQNVNLECGYDKPDGSRHYPSTILSCAFPTPAPGSCKLLKHHEVVTLFHELGHGIHDLLSKTKFVSFHGSNRLPVDAGEMPSMFLENFVWLEDVLSELSCHYTALDLDYLSKWQKENPGEPDPSRTIPGGLVQALQKSRYINRGLFHSHQLSVSIFDMKIHGVQSSNGVDKLRTKDLWYSLREEIEKMDFGDVKAHGADFTAFAHLVSGYDVGYYGYLACSAFAQDIWQSKFFENPRDHKTWNQYRRMILEYGGAHPDKLQMISDFLGREPNVDALVESLEQAQSSVGVNRL